MKITFVQNEKEKAESDAAIRAGLLPEKAEAGTWILPPAITFSHKFVVVDSPSGGKDVSVESFDTIDGALLYALGIRGDSNIVWDVHDAVKDVNGGNFV